MLCTWWRPETGAIMIGPPPGTAQPATAQSGPGPTGRPLPGVVADVVGETGAEAGRGVPGHLVLLEPWPGMARTIWRDDQRFVDTFWSLFDGM